MGAKFQWLKMNFGLKKMELYKKALLWITTDEKAKQNYPNNENN
jgi:hypothetical protein